MKLEEWRIASAGLQTTQHTAMHLSTGIAGQPLTALRDDMGENIQVPVGIYIVLEKVRGVQAMVIHR